MKLNINPLEEILLLLKDLYMYIFTININTIYKFYLFISNSLDIVMKFTINFISGANSNHSLQKVPGSRLEKIIVFLFPKKFAREIVVQTIRDVQVEYIEALADGNSLLARWRSLTLYPLVLLTIVIGIKVSIIKQFVEIWKLL